MQTFVPYADFAKSASVLDRQRLGKQRVEVLQILNSLTGKSNGWMNHPAVKMWSGHEAGLAAYGISICEEWISRGYNDTCSEKISILAQPDYSDYPEWWEDERVHSSHRSNLLRKFPEHYLQFGWLENSDIPYFWPESTQLVSATTGR